MAGSVPEVPSYAVVIKAHAWDGFIIRQLERFKARTDRGRLFLVVDETNSPLGDIVWEDLVRVTTRDAVALGLADRTERNSLFWWNTDYLHYIFFNRYPCFDYYLFAEYDVLIQCDIDELVIKVAAGGADLVAMPTRGRIEDWMWTRFHALTYASDRIRGSLNCLSILSKPAMQQLYKRRLELSAASARGEVDFWPFNEVFMATETVAAGLSFQSLAAFGDISGYEWFPPHLEEDVIRNPILTFVHPILDRKRYIESLLRFEPHLLAYHRLDSQLRRELSRFNEAEYKPMLWPAFFRRLRLVSVERWQNIRCQLQLHSRC